MVKPIENLLSQKNYSPFLHHTVPSHWASFGRDYQQCQMLLHRMSTTKAESGINKVCYGMEQRIVMYAKYIKVSTILWSLSPRFQGRWSARYQGRQNTRIQGITVSITGRAESPVWIFKMRISLGTVILILIHNTTDAFDIFFLLLTAPQPRSTGVPSSSFLTALQP